jgi:hypothetical protein
VIVIVILVILLVVVSLRGESKPQASLPPPPKEEPAKVEEPKPAVPEAANPTPNKPDDKPAPGGRAGKHGGRVVRSVGPTPEKPPVEKQPAKPAHNDTARPNPFDEAKTVSQQQISAVVRNKGNQMALKACYERALKMDNHLTSGRIDVTVSIGTSGTVQRVVINAPSSFILVEPCIKNAVKRWVFPPNVEEYATNFPLIMQGGM